MWGVGMGIVPVGAIQSVVNSLLADRSVTVSVTYKQISSSYSTTTLDTTETETEVSCRALKVAYTLAEIANSAGNVQAGDLRFIIRATVLSSITPTQGDRIVWGGTEWEGPALWKGCPPPSLQGRRRPP